jgi:hypothetical protein
MRVRLMIIAGGALALATGGAAEPAKAPAAQRPIRSAPVIFASADQVTTPAPVSDQATPPAPKRPRAARVTTCRCGDPQPEPQPEP